MKTVKRIVTLLICLSLCLSLGAAGFALQEYETEEQRDTKLADAMHGLGLFMGVGENEDGTVNYDLDRAPTRIEALVMLVRLLGKEAEAVELGKTHSFTDVPEWADGYVSYAVETGLTKGVSETLFDCESEIKSDTYMTFLLRALGYSDGQNGDFLWNEPYALAVMLHFGTNFCDVTRADTMTMSAQALFANLKGGKTPLYEKLISDGAFTAEEFENAALPEHTSIRDSLAGRVEKFNSYDKALEYAESRIGGVDTEVLEMEETDYYTLLITTPAAVPPGSVTYDVILVYKDGSALGEGTLILLPYPPANALGYSGRPDTVSFSEDGTELVYTYTFEEAIYYGNDEHVRRKAGTFTYTTNLSTGITAVTFLPKEYITNDSTKYEKPNMGISIEFPSSWSGRYAIEGRAINQFTVYTYWGRQLCKVFSRDTSVWTQGGESELYPEYIVLGEKDDEVYILAFVNSAQFDPESEEQLAAYNEMRADLYNVKFEFID